MIAVSNIKDYEKLSNQFEHVSFDLFDTLIFRETLQSLEIQELSSEFACGLLCQNDIHDVSVDRFLLYRKKFTSELKSSISLNTNEPEISLVFKRVLGHFGVPYNKLSAAALEITKFELALEIYSLKTIPEAQILLKNLKSNGIEITVITDMYFSKEDIQKILIATKLDGYIDNLFVSSDCGVTKRDSSLYLTVLKKLNLEANKLIHIGDNFYSDVKCASQIGINSVFYNRSVKLKKQHLILDSDIGLDSYIADLVLAFIYQIALTSCGSGLKRIYFLSRDATRIGELFKYSANNVPLIKKLVENTEVRFLSVSRTSCMFLKLKSNDSQLEQILNVYLEFNVKGYKLNEFYSFLGLDESVFKNSCCNNEIIKNTEGVKLFSSILKDKEPALTSRIIQAANEHANNIIEYLRQESVVGATGPIGFVDIGYSGSVSRDIASYIYRELGESEYSKFNLHMMMLCGGNHYSSTANNNDSLVKFYDPLIIDRHLSTLLRLNFSWLEVFFQNNNLGPLSGYKYIKSRWEPIFNEVSIDTVRQFNWYDACIDKIHTGLNLELFLSKKHISSVLERVLGVMANPNLSIVKQIQTIPFNKGNEYISIVDTKIRPTKLFEKKYIKKLATNDIWIAGSLVIINRKWLRLPLKILLSIYFQLTLVFRRLEKLIQRCLSVSKKIFVRLR